MSQINRGRTPGRPAGAPVSSLNSSVTSSVYTAGAALVALGALGALVTGCGGDPDPGQDPGLLELPDVAYCEPAQSWPENRVELERQVLELVNEFRAEGADCGSEGSFASAEPLVLEPALTCAARVHSMDMAERGYFSHNTPEGVSPWDRMEQATYMVNGPRGENIATGSNSADGVMSLWMSSDGHCSNIMNPAFTEIGIGYYDGNLWTQTFGAQ